MGKDFKINFTLAHVSEKQKNLADQNTGRNYGKGTERELKDLEKLFAEMKRYLRNGK